MKPCTRSRSGPARDRDGRFIKGRSVAVALDPGPDGLNVAVALQDKPVQVLPQVEATVLVAATAVNLDQLHSAEDDEVSGCDLDGTCLDSSPTDSDFDNEDVGKSVEEQELCSTQLKKIGNFVAQQVLDEMPHSDPTAIGVNRGGGSTAKVSERAAGNVPKAPWVNLFKDNRNLGNGVMLHEVDVEGDLVQLDEEDVDEVDEAVGICLVGLFTGQFPGVGAIRSLMEGWKVECRHWIHRSGWILFQFQSEDDRLNVLNGGPYFAYGRNLMLKILPRCFRFGSEEMTSVPVWIQLPDLPFDCWNDRALSKIVSKVGVPITTDKLTRTRERISFARVLVEVDVSMELVTSVEVKLPTGVIYDQLVVFESTPKYCKICMTFGHGDVGCNKEAGGRFVPLFMPKKKIQHGGVVAGNMEGGRPLSDKPKVGEASAMKEGVLLDELDQPAPCGSGSKVDHARQTSGAGSGSCKQVLVGAGLQPVAAVPPSPSGCPVVDPVAGSEGGPSAGKKKKKILKSGQLEGAAVQIQSDGESLRSEPVGVASSGQDRRQHTKGGKGREDVEGLSHSAGRPASPGPVAKEVQTAVRNLVAQAGVAAPPSMQLEEGLAVGGAASGSLVAGLLPTKSSLVDGTNESVDGGWTSVGKKGKKKKNSGRPVVAAVQQQPDDIGRQVEHVAAGVAAVHHQQVGDVGGGDAMLQQVGRQCMADVQHRPVGVDSGAAVLQQSVGVAAVQQQAVRSDEVAAGEEPDTRSWAERNDMVSVGSGYVSREILMRKGRRYFRGWR